VLEDGVQGETVGSTTGGMGFASKMTARVDEQLSASQRHTFQVVCLE
jgi:hypothetical protein